jgi:thioredoxin-related protein
MISILRMTRRQWGLLTSASIALPGVAATTTRLPTSTALASDLARALANDRPLLVMVSLEGCPYCKIVRENYLGPMREREGLAVVQIDMRNKSVVTDFQGKAWTQDELIRSWGVKVAPTVLFFGKGGAEVAERMVGGYIPDFYGSYLDDRLRAARAAVKS